MPITDNNCYICGEEISAENYYYISTGRLQQGVMSDPKAYKEYVLCTNCYAMVNAELIASIQKRKNEQQKK